ncbi:MAG: Hca operon transcriptional activator HcaR [Pseudomonas citronellolis]|nr:MAG: Hca operon transcriptional activator HcaR [Pseudomonas citronellolis]
MRELEDSLGTPLLVRGARQVELTAAGQAYRPLAQRLLNDLQAAGQLARQVGAGQQGRLRLGHSSSVPLVAPLQTALRDYLASHPGVSVEWVQQSSEEQLADLQEERLDACLLRLPVLRQYPDLELHVLYEEALLLALPHEHPLASDDTPLALARLEHEPFVSIPHLQRGGLSYRAAQLCLDAGFYPRAAAAVSRKTSQLQLIEAGFGVALVAESMRSLAPAGVRLRPLADAQAHSEVALAWRRGAGSLVQGWVEHLLQRWPAREKR